MFFPHLPQRAFRAGLVAVTVAGLLLTAGCSGRGDTSGNAGESPEEATAGHTVTQISIVTPEKESDHGWNQQGIWAAQAAADELGLILDENTNVGYDNTETILRQIAASGTDLIFAHASGFNAAGHRIGLSTGVPTLVVDFENNEPGKVGTVIPQAQEGAYLAGVAAAHKTATNTIGIVASAENLNWFLMAGGFAQGVYSVDPEIDVVIAYVGPAAYGDSAGGKNVMNQVIAAGADVIMGMGDGATIGYLQALESATTDYPLSYIATIGDVTEIVTNPDLVFTSVLWSYQDVFMQAVADVEAGTFGTETYELNVANGGLSLQDTPQLTGDIAAAVEQARAAIIDGSVTVVQATTKNAVQDVIDARGK